ncbi:hypothetical protein EDD86DRAFT_190712 [Gorgonomyces haynaldii]|nr:hypothetical protein EDD86DRAFT_190712 [Gorgonomyces haynaldii]
MQTFSTKNQQRTGNALALEGSLSTLDAPTAKKGIYKVSSPSFIYDYTFKNPNTTSWGIAFNQSTTNSKNIQYQVWFNASNVINGSDIFSRYVLSVVRGVDEALISVMNDPTVSITYDIDVKLKDWPLAPPATLGDTIVQKLGPVFFFCSEMIIFINVLSTIVSEKELKLRHGMEVMGLKPYIYWTSHYLSYTLLVIVNALCATAWGYIFNFQAFRDTNAGIHIVNFFLFGESMVMFAFFITTFVRRTRVAILIGIFIFIIGLLFESFVFSSSYLGYIWWSETTIDKAGWLCLMFIPFFNFGHMFLDINILTTGKLDQLTNTYVPGPGFPWSQLYNDIPLSVKPYYGTDPPNLPLPVQAWYLMIMDIAVYGLLMWYFDNVIPNEFGYSRPPWFFLTLDYWGIELKKETVLKEWQQRYSSPKETVEPEGNEDSDVVQARTRALDSEFFPALKILNLRKVYRNFGSEDDKIAVRGSCFCVEEGKLLGLLGQNGAGKSTTIGMLSGLTPATSGDALIYGHSVKTQMNEIRKIMGICPQHDILFDDLTAREHIALYAGLKGVPPEQWEPLIQQRLGQVKLLSVADVRAGTYSGGMKRRLSLVISTIGDPKIIFMDEPTTGMDPVNRRHVWSFVEKFKKGRVIILTTHSMEEADVLGDRIAVMSKGRLRAINNSIALKNKFGSGYRISVVTNKSDAPKMKEIVKQMIPGAQLEDDSAGALIYQFKSPDAIPQFIKFLEDNSEGLVKTWGISQSTLEEVFLKLIRETKDL